MNKEFYQSLAKMVYSSTAFCKYLSATEGKTDHSNSDLERT